MGGRRVLLLFCRAVAAFSLHFRSPRLLLCVHKKKNAALLNGRERENKTLRGVAPVFKLLINAIDLWPASSPRATGQLVFQCMQCFTYHEADSYWGNISYATKVLLMYAQRLGGQSLGKRIWMSAAAWVCKGGGVGGGGVGGWLKVHNITYAGRLECALRYAFC